ncbi:hypothetical protein IX51_07640 [uncultured archaeon]|nr:hypothetical protein IX51_07640 [uncultured archaeon]
MPKDDRVCTEVLNEIISRYSRIAFEKGGEEKEEATLGVVEQKNGTEEEFWAWFCKEMKNKSFRDCFEKSEREDFYGSLSAVRKEYDSRCKD